MSFFEGLMLGSVHRELRAISSALETDGQRKDSQNSDGVVICFWFFVILCWIVFSYWQIVLAFSAVCIFALILYSIFKEENSEVKPLTRGSYDWYINEFCSKTKWRDESLDKYFLNDLSINELYQMHSAVSRLNSINQLAPLELKTFAYLSGYIQRMENN
jgi:hypothetical protein